MNERVSLILDRLARVDAERARRAACPALAERVAALKGWQQQRFARTYADLLASSRYAGASRFFLDELYGPTDFTARDAQFARVVPALVRLFPGEIVETVTTLAELHALSEELDTRMGELVPTPEIDEAVYATAWRATGRREDRQRQIDLTLRVGRDLDHMVRSVALRQGLRLMRGPARAAGLSDLQRFLESGFDTFRGMRGADEFLGIVAGREAAFARAMFDGGPGAAGAMR